MSTLVMDGVRRPVGTAVLDLRGPVVPLAIPTPMEVVEHTSVSPLVAFGLVAVTLGMSGATMAGSVQHLSQLSVARAAVSPSPGSKMAALPAVVPIKGQLQPLLDQFVAGDRDDWGITVTNLKTGETASINPERTMESASLYKLFMAQAVYQAIDAGTLSYSQDAGAGTGQSIQDCLTAMITVSDNTCGRALGTLVGWDALNPGLAANGFTGTDMANPVQTTSAHDVALIFQRLYAGTLASPANNANFMNLLKSQQVNNRLPVGLPAGTVIAHKTGDLDGFVHDAGIVYGPKSDYLVVVMSGPWDAPGTAPDRIAQLSDQLYSYFEN